MGLVPARQPPFLSDADTGFFLPLCPPPVLHLRVQFPPLPTVDARLAADPQRCATTCWGRVTGLT